MIIEFVYSFDERVNESRVEVNVYGKHTTQYLLSVFNLIIFQKVS